MLTFHAAVDLFTSEVWTAAEVPGFPLEFKLPFTDIVLHVSEVFHERVLIYLRLLSRDYIN